MKERLIMAEPSRLPDDVYDKEGNSRPVWRGQWWVRVLHSPKNVAPAEYLTRVRNERKNECLGDRDA